MATTEHTVQLAIEMGRQGRPLDGIAHLRRYLQRQPSNLMASAALGQLLMQAGQFDQALFQFQRCRDAAPTMPANHNNLGMILGAMGRNEEAIAEFRESVRLDPGYATGWVGLSMQLLLVPDYEGAAAAARKAISLRPEVVQSYHNLALGLLESGQVEESIAAMREGLRHEPDHAALGSMLLMALNYRSELSPEQLRQEHELFGRMHPPSPRGTPARTDPDPDRKLRIGVLSSDLRGHSVMYFFEPVMEHHDRGGFEYVCFSGSRKADETTARLRGHATAWIDASAPDDAVADRLVRERRIDILLELGGHSARNRLPALKDKPAPVIATAIGYPNTTGMAAVDYRIVDSLSDPPGSESHATERLVRLDPCFLCYRPQESSDPAPVPSAGGGPVMFGSFNSLQKLSLQTLRTWAALLARVPGSRIALKTGGLENTWARNTLLARFADVGVPAERVELLAPTKGIEEHLKLYARVDVALDPFPYNGTTTTCESLWMGVPVVALAGNRHAARVGLSLLSAVGLREFVADTPERYVEIAAALAGDAARRAELRRGLRPMVAGSVLCDGPAYVRRFETVLRGMWREWCAGQNSKAAKQQSSK